MRRIVRCSEEDYRRLAGIWERSVLATHDFLSEDDFKDIQSALISDYFPGVDLYAVADGDSFAGFIGLRADSIEMLFVDSDMRGRGYGSFMVDFAKRRGACRVEVNEQNPSALKFYLANGFRINGRDATDDAGRPYPLLHLTLSDQSF